MMSQSASPQGFEKSKKQRRKHKNSKLGCLQCKERRMKCNEELPECRNCRIRQVKIPCSYLAFTEDEKKEFRSLKAKQSAEASAGSSSSIWPSPTSNSPNESRDPITLPLVKHVKLNTLASQNVVFVNETPNSMAGRLFFSKIINDSFFNFEESFTCHFTLTSRWLILQMSKRLNALNPEDKDYQNRIQHLERIAIESKSLAINYLRSCVLKLIEAQEQSDFRRCAYFFGQMTIPTICLQVADIWSQTTIKGFYISGAVTALSELYQRTPDRSPAAQFIGKTFVITNQHLFIPNYPHSVLEEVFEVVESMGELINNTNDDLLIYHYENMLNFFEEELSLQTLEDNYNPKNVTAYPASMLYSIYFKFNQILPSEVYTINTCDQPVHRTFFLLCYAIARVLDNIFPETRYITKFRFIGPTSMYPFFNDDIYLDLPDELLFYVNYGSRLLAYFTRRSDLFSKYMTIQNLFPDSLAQNRMKSRKAKVSEDFITKFKTTVIEPKHYPQVLETGRSQSQSTPSPPSSTSSGCSSSSFSINFQASYSLSFDLSKTLSLDPRQLTTTAPPTIATPSSLSINSSPIVNWYDIAPSGLLTDDYDPLNDDPEELPIADATHVSLLKCVEDYTKLMKEFIK